mmetsp:Transcript_17314/g.25779  ORF Transcript_17314/g.25779 Transcript_17314/m.25779 type:complete len:134 (-) Transcript_17314:82-483(-)
MEDNNNVCSMPCPITGRFVLHEAIRQALRWNDYVLQSIYNAAPGVVDCVDKDTGLLPYMLAAASTSSSSSDEEEQECDRLTLIYELMRCSSIKIPAPPSRSINNRRRRRNSVEMKKNAWISNMRRRFVVASCC